MGYRIQGTQPVGAKIWKTSLKIGITTTSKVDDIHMSWSKKDYIVIVGVYSSWKCDNFTLLQRHFLNRLYRTYQHPHRYESISNWACRNIGMNTVHRNPHNWKLYGEIVPCMHPTSYPNNSAMAIGHTHISAVVADGLVLFCAMSSADIMFDGCRYCFRTKPVLIHTTKCNRIECSWVIITTPGWVLLAWLYLVPCYQRRSWWRRNARF